MLFAILLERMPAIAGRGDRQPVECDHMHMRAIFRVGGGRSVAVFRRGFHQHPPGFIVGLAAVAEEFAAHFDQRARDAVCAQSRGDEIGAVAFGDRRQIQHDAAGLRQPRRIVFEHEPPPADACARRIERRCLRHAARPLRRAESPGVDQRAEGRVVSAAAGFGDLQRTAQHGMEFGRQRMNAAGRAAVVAADVAVVAPRAHLRDHGIQGRLHDTVNRVQVGARRARCLHRPGGAHRRPAEGGDA